MRTRNALKWGKFYFILAIIAMSPFYVRAQNLVANGNFNNNDANWTFFAPGIEVEAYASEPTYGGPNANNIVAEVDMDADLQQTNIPVVAGQAYWLSFRRSRRQEAGTPNPALLFIRVFDATASYIADTLTSVNTVWDWQCKTYQFTPTTNSVTINFGTQSNIDLGTLVDDITITPVAQIITTNSVSCQGGTATFHAPDSTENSNYSGYVWTGPNGFTASGTNITLDNIQPSQSGDYVCTMQLNGCLTVSGTYHLNVIPTTFVINKEICQGQIYSFYGRSLHNAGQYDTVLAGVGTACDSTIILNLIVNPLPDAVTYPQGYLRVCMGDTISLQVKNKVQGSTYQWATLAGAIPGETSSNYPASQENKYSVTVTSDKGCIKVSAPINFYVNPLPTAAIKINDNNIPCISDTVSLTAMTTNVFAYNWSPSELFKSTNTADQKDGEAILNNSDTRIVLTILDSIGCRAKDSVNIQAKACCRLFLPTAFTPNGDGTNDYFLPHINRNQTVIASRIFDRWGKMVYSSDNDISKKGWNGNYPDGKPALQGVYMYGIEYTCSDRSNQFVKGDVTLLR